MQTSTIQNISLPTSAAPPRAFHEEEEELQKLLEGAWQVDGNGYWYVTCAWCSRTINDGHKRTHEYWRHRVLLHYQICATFTRALNVLTTAEQLGVAVGASTPLLPEVVGGVLES